MKRYFNKFFLVFSFFVFVFIFQASNVLACSFAFDKNSGDTILSGSQIITGTCSSDCSVNYYSKLTLNAPYQNSGYFTMTSTNYTIQCDLDTNTWNSNFNIPLGNFSLYINNYIQIEPFAPYDYGPIANVALNGVSFYDNSWSIKITNYDLDYLNNVGTVASGTSFSPEFYFTVPAYTDKTKVNVSLWHSPDKYYLSNMLMNYGTIDGLEYPINYIDFGNITSNSNGNKYFELDFQDENFNTVYVYRFSDVEAQTSTPDLGFWGNIFYKLFIPPNSYFSSFISQIYLSLKGVMPFCYFFEVQDLFSSYDVTAVDFTLPLTIPFAGGTTTFNLMDTSDSNLHLFMDQWRVYISMALWVLFLIYLLERIMDLEF